MRTIIIGIINLYRPIRSFLLPPSCRFHPSCSRYAEEALRTHDIFRAALLTARRLLKCHPFNPGGFDPCPPTQKVPLNG